MLPMQTNRIRKVGIFSSLSWQADELPVTKVSTEWATTTTAPRLLDSGARLPSVVSPPKFYPIQISG
jgi:hypothetical protein